VAVLGVGSATGLYEFRQHQLHVKLMADRAAGMAAYQAGDYDTALNDLSHYNQNDQHDPETLFTFARVRSRIELPNEKHLLEAISYYRRGLEIDPKNTTAKHELLAIYVNPYIAYDAEAVTLCDELLKNNPNDVEALRAKATALYRMHRLEDAIAVADRVTELAPTDMRGQQLDYELMYQLNRPAGKIIGKAQKDLKVHANDPRFEMLLGYAYMLTGDFDSSRTHLMAAARAKQTDPVAVEQLCGMLDSLHMYDESNALLARSADQNANPEMQRMLIRRLWQTGDFAQVIARLKDLRLKDGDSQLLAYDAMSLYQMNRSADADKIMAALQTRTHDDVAMAWVKAIEAQFAQPALGASERVARFQSALSRDPNNAVIRDMLGSAYAELGESEPALTQWKMAEDAEPSWSAPRTQTARLLAATGRDQMAIDEAQKAYDRSQNVGSAIGLVVAWSKAAETSDDPAVAQKVLGLVSEIQAKIPDEPQTLPIYVAMLARTGQRSKAVAVVKNVMNSPRVLDDSTLIELANVSQAMHLGMEKQLLAQAEKLHGMTPELALAMANDTAAAGDTKSAEANLRTQAAAAKTEQTAWQLALAEYLQAHHSTEATKTWIELGNANPNDLSVQGAIVDLPENSGVWQDRAFVQTSIDRLRAITGDEGHRWQLAQARWLLGSPNKDRDSAAAVVLLTELVRTSPDMLLPRMYLTRALENLNETTQAIEQLKGAASIDPDSPTISLELVRLMQSQGQFDDAAPYLNKLAQNKSLNAQQRLQVALLQAAAGQRDAALAMLGQNGGAEGLALRAELLRQRGESTAAKQLYQQIISDPNSEPQSLVEAAEFFAAHNDTTSAQRAIAALDHKNLSAEKRSLLVADYDEDRGNATAAESLLKSDAEKNNDPTEWQALAGFEFRQGNDPAALEAANHPGVSADLKTDIERMSHVSIKLAQRSLREALSHNPADAAGRQTLAALAQLGTLDQVAGQLTACAEKFPRFMPAQKLAFEASLKLHHMDDAMRIANRCAQVFPTDAEAAEMPVMAHAAAGQWSDMLLAAQMWRQRASENPMEADRAIAEAQMQMAEADQAVHQLSPYITAAQKNPDANASLIGDYCRALILNNRQGDAAKILKPLLSQKQWRTLWLQLASDVHGADAAASWIAQVEGTVPQEDVAQRESLCGAWYGLGVRYGYAAGFANARRVIAPIAASADAPNTAHLLMAGVCEKLGDRTAAVSAYRKALQIDPNLPMAENNLAYDLMMQNQNLDEARTLAQKAVAAHADDPAYRDTLGQILIRLGDKQGAIQTYQTLVQMQPNNVSAQIALAQTLLADGKRDSASRVVAQIDSLLQADPGNSATYQQDVQALHQSLK
jgi:tetratricopeptide (TPR) repeat protein